MNNGHIANPELRHRSLSQSVHLVERHLLVRLVVEVPSTPPAGIVAHNSVEYDNRSISRLLDSFNDLLGADAVPHNRRLAGSATDRRQECNLVVRMQPSLRPRVFP